MKQTNKQTHTKYCAFIVDFFLAAYFKFINSAGSFFFTLFARNVGHSSKALYPSLSGGDSGDVSEVKLKPHRGEELKNVKIRENIRKAELIYV